MKDSEICKVVKLDKTTSEYKIIERKFLDSVKKGVFNTGKAPKPAANPIGQFNNIQVTQVNG